MTNKILWSSNSKNTLIEKFINKIFIYTNKKDYLSIHKWSIERNNIFAGTEAHYFQQAETNLPTGKSNNAFLKEIDVWGSG